MYRRETINNSMMPTKFRGHIVRMEQAFQNYIQRNTEIIVMITELKGGRPQIYTQIQKLDILR